jgi:hypothetical protein
MATIPKLITYQQFFQMSGVLPDLLNQLLTAGTIKVLWKNNKMFIYEETALAYCSTLPEGKWKPKGGTDLFYSPAPKNVDAGYPKR